MWKILHFACMNKDYQPGNLDHTYQSSFLYFVSRKLRFWLRRIACAMAKTKAMCIINRTDKLIRIQHEKKHGKGSKNSSAYFDNKMIEEEEMEKQIDDGTFDECAYVKDDDDLCA